MATGQLDNTERLGEVKKDIARALTILRARDLSEEDVELEPLVLTPARRLPIDESGGVDEVADEDEDERPTRKADDRGRRRDRPGARGRHAVRSLRRRGRARCCRGLGDLESGDEEDAQ